MDMKPVTGRSLVTIGAPFHHTLDLQPAVGMPGSVQCRQLVLDCDRFSGRVKSFVYDPLPAERLRLGLPTAGDMETIFAAPPPVYAGYVRRLRDGAMPRGALFFQLLRRLHPGAHARCVEHGFGFVFNNLIAAGCAGFPEVVAMEMDEEARQRLLEEQSLSPAWLGGVAVYDTRQDTIEGDVVIWSHPTGCNMHTSVAKLVRHGGDLVIQTDLHDELLLMLPQSREWVRVGRWNAPIFPSVHQLGAEVVWMHRLPAGVQVNSYSE